jgi:hypothetical protein
VERVINNCGKLVGGGANQTAMLEVFGASKSMLQMIAVDVLVANLWMGFYFMGSKSDKIDKWLKADNAQ